MSEHYDWCKSEKTLRYAGKDYCIFHAPSVVGFKTDRFNNQIFAKIDEAKKIDEICDLSGIIFKGAISFSRFNYKNPLPRIRLRNAEFNEITDFSGVNFDHETNFSMVKFKNTVYFDNAEFAKETIFSRVQFDGHSFFNKTQFKRKAHFSSAKFNNYSYFEYAIFSKDSNFEKAQFSKDVIFFKAKFGTDNISSSPVANFIAAKFLGEADFRGSNFYGNAEFIATEFSNETNFSVVTFNKAVFTHSRFNGETHFQDSVFGQSIDFRRTRFNEDADFSGASFDGFVDFSLARFHELARFSKRKKNYVFNGEVRFVDIIIRDKLRFTDVNLSKISFLYSDVKKIDFIGCEWGEKNGHYVLYDEIIIFKNKNDSNFEDKIKKVENLYRRLKQKYKEEHNEQEVSNWHYCEKEIQKAREKNKYFKFIYTLYYRSSGYGEKPSYALIVLVALIVILTFILNCIGVQTNPVYCSDSACVTIQGFSMKLDIQRLISLIWTTVQHVLFVRTPDYIPSIDSDYGKLIVLLFSKLFIPLQAALLAFSIRNTFRR